MNLRNRLAIMRHRRRDRKWRQDFPFAEYPYGSRLGAGGAAEWGTRDWTWNAPTMAEGSPPVILPIVPRADTRLAAHGTDETPLRYPPRSRLLTPGAESAYDPFTAMNRVHARRRGEGSPL